MKRLLLSAAFVTAALSGGSAYAACGDITLAVFSWQSAEAMSNVDKFILNNGYGCNASVIAGDTVPTITSMIEKGEPDIASPSGVKPQTWLPWLAVTKTFPSVLTATSNARPIPVPTTVA